MNCNVIWRFRFKSEVLPALEVIAECEHIIGYPYMIAKSLCLIEEAKAFQGVPISDGPNEEEMEDVLIRVTLSLFFSSFASANKFIEYLQNKPRF